MRVSIRLRYSIRQPHLRVVASTAGEGSIAAASSISESKIVAAFLIVLCVVAVPREAFVVFGGCVLLLAVVSAVARIPPRIVVDAEAGRQFVIGGNKYVTDTDELRVNNAAAHREKVEKLRQLRAE